MSTRLFATFVLLILGTGAFAQDKEAALQDITRLLDGCRIVMSATSLTTENQSNYKMGYCAGYLHASYTQQRVWQQLSSVKDKGACLPDNFHLPDFARLVVEYADNNPEHENESLWALIYRAYVGRYPCGEDAL